MPPDRLAARVRATLFHDKVQDLVAEREEILQRCLLARREARRGARRD